MKTNPTENPLCSAPKRAHGVFEPANVEANARLIAAAPELLAALEADAAAKQLERQVTPACNLTLKGAARASVARKAHQARMHANEMMRAAIAKAKGE